MLNKKMKYYIIFIIMILLPCVNLYPQAGGKTEENLFKKAEGYFFQNKLEMAELLLQEELKKNPENQKAYSYLGDILLKKGKYDEAMVLYRKSLDIDPDNAFEYFRIGQIFYYKKESGPAIENFERSYKLNPRLKFAYYHIGLAYLMLRRDKEGTIKNWQNFVDIAPDDPQAEKIKKAIELLRDPNFVIPPEGSDISIEEALQLGGSVLQETERKANEKKADHEKKKTKQKLEDVYRDDAL
ncbi:MAG: tetratricopeptide repeat protein [Spirochaetes bacterium]|jgi:tetratricopeptide (TPR) repeat protein|nr:tetratricopeptide repeat protein [Spirochaetota bacterium]